MRNPTSDLDQLLGSVKSLASPFRALLNELLVKYKSLTDGRVADYIPELAKADPALFGISAVTTAGQSFDVGDCETLFTIQSISKPFVYGLALETHGREKTLSKVGVEPTGDAFNSLIRLDEKSKRPHNPMVNAGAIATADLVPGVGPTERLHRILEMFGRYAGRPIDVNMPVFVSERATGHRNRAIAHLMLNFGMIGDNLTESLDLYFQQCSLMVNSHDLAVMAATLANDGVNPVTGERALDSQYIKDILSVMLSCGMYDFSGEWCYQVGLPAKSGVGGGIIAVVPGRLGIAVLSPPLDSHGNSARGVQVCTELSQRLGLHIFDSSGAEKLQALLAARSSGSPPA